VTDVEVLCREIERLRSQVQEGRYRCRELERENYVLVRKLRRIENTKPMVDRIMEAVGLGKSSSSQSQPRAAAEGAALEEMHKLREVQRHFDWLRENGRMQSTSRF